MSKQWNLFFPHDDAGNLIQIPLSREDYKAAKEAFVSNHHGTSIYEIILATIPLPAALWAYAEYKALRQLSGNTAPNLLKAFIYEFVLLIVPQILAQTSPHMTPWIILALCGIAGLCRGLILYKTSSSISSSPSSSSSKSPRNVASTIIALQSKWRHDRAARLIHSSSRNYLSNYRAGVMLTSAIAILAVDFQIFPRRFAKTETFGTSLMDLGVGCFMFSSGLCSRPARNYHTLHAAGGIGGGIGVPGVVGVTGAGGRATTTARMLLATLRRCLPLILLGAGRLIVNRGIDYHEHISEYGVHWNFFLTVASVQMAAAALHAVFPHNALFPLSLVIIVIYQMKLSLGGLTDYILHAPRDINSFFSQNREGIMGVPGFLCISLVGEQVGTWTLWRSTPPGGGMKAAEQNARNALTKLLCLDASLWGAALATSWLVQPISRRLVNMPYVLWSSAHNVLVLTILLAVDTLATIPASSQVLSAVNRNELAFFLVANLMTGAVNLSMRTIFSPTSMAMTIIFGYMLSLVLVFVLLDRVFNVTLKLW